MLTSDKIVIKNKQELIAEILESGARYVSTSISLEPCAVAIAIQDIEDSDADFKAMDFWWEERSTGLDESDY